MPEQVFTVGALETIRDMARHGTNINRIRTALHKSEGVWFKDIDIIAAGRMFGFTIVPISHGSNPGDPIRLVEPIRRPGRPIDKIALVPPGTYPTRGFTMIGRRNV